eukprot:TRINITY_DN30380_c0_g1_i1.p1 TRINITY_DN30380_c0_g1~~TRINITY_DN30380_c0_g1_i1.p1  ORF type:complete len:505 (-),score=97.59 TRINITY_DN30380_c0_g1_i1:153-1667(-)
MGRSRAQTAGVNKADVVTRHKSSRAIAGFYEVVRELGAGSFGRVCLVQDRQFEVEKVCKFVKTQGMQRHTLELMKKEIATLRTLDHPSIVRLFAHVEDSQASELVLVLEYIPGRDAEELVKQATSPLPDRLVARLLYQLFRALAYCHCRGVTHRDIKLQNLMVIDPPDGGDPDCKLIDFGLADLRAEGMQDYVGTPKFMAPEVHRRAVYTSKADIWSVGVTAVELLSREAAFAQPYDRIGGYRDFSVVEDRLANCPGWTERDEDAQGLVRWLMQANPDDRPTADAALEERWLGVHRPKMQRFPKEIARSMAGYVRAPPVVRCCLLCIAARIGTTDADSIGHAFLGADSDGDGLVSAEDLEVALSGMEGVKWWCDPASRVDVEEVVDSANLSHQDGISFTEFVAACLFANHATLEDLASEAFHALDDDRDGYVRVTDIVSLFRERDRPFLRTLPQHEPFDLEEWCERVRDYGHGEVSSDDPDVSIENVSCTTGSGGCYNPFLTSC